MPSRILQKYPTQKLFGLRVFLISIITATALFLPFIIMGGGVFYYYGDFNVQEIPFYQLVHDAVRNGDTGWMHNVDLGTDMLSSFSFYLLGSPFFWLTIPFPSTVSYRTVADIKIRLCVTFRISLFEKICG